jgi:hypothetical protein
MGYCSRCVLPDNYPFITFNAAGECNYCLDHKPRSYSGIDKLLGSIENNRNPQAAYDCLAGLSGGRDSTYMLHYLVRELDLKVLACTFDNGFIPPVTWDNIFSTIQSLGVDHIIVKSDAVRSNAQYILSGLIQKPSPAMVSMLCAGCRTGYVRMITKIASETGCRVSISGGGERAGSPATMLLARSPKPDSRSMIAGFIRELIINPFYLSHPVDLTRLLIEFYTRFMPVSQKNRPFRFLPLFLFIEWNENMIISTITNELGWRTPEKMSSGWRSDCKIHQIRQYLYQELLGYTKNNDLLSQMVRNHQINQSQALRRLATENQVSPILLDEILTEMGFTFSDLERSIQQAIT